MARAYREQLTDLVVMLDATGTRAAAEFTVHGEYLQAEEGMPPPAANATCCQPAPFLTLRDGRICRVATCYNLADWMAQVSR